MNASTLKTISYATSFAFLGGIGYVGYDYYENGRTAVYFDVERAGEVLNGVKAPPPQRSTALDYGRDITPSIVDFDWTGKPPPEVAVKDPNAPDEPVELIVRVEEILEAIFVAYEGNNPGDSRCLLRFRDSTVKPRAILCKVGDTLPPPNDGVSVLRILDQGVEFSFAQPGREPEMIALSQRARESDLISAVSPEGIAQRRLVGSGGGSASLRQGPPLQTERRSGQYYVGTEDAALLGQSYQDVLSKDVTTRTYFEDGERAGVELTEVRQNSVASRLGAQSGDVVISVNGHPVTSEQEAIQFAKANSSKYSVWEVQVMRLGRVETLIYHSPEE
ncbi:MAG: PDZ domain-containing protein [Planctomycetota bacterium]